MDILGKAIALASAAHAEQMDKSGDPYILHPLRMMMRMRQQRQPVAHQCVAVLHDVVEDTNVTMEVIRDHFGDGDGLIVAGVDAMTRRWDGKEGEAYKEYIYRCCGNRIALSVKRYDLEDNMDPRRWHPDVPYKRYLWTLQYMMELADVARHRAEHGVVS